MDYTFAEYADMLLIYGEVHCNGKAALRLYQERVPERRVPAIREEFEEEVLRQFEENPGVSTRAVAKRMKNVSHVRVWEIVNEQLLHPYHRQKVQELGPDDYAPRVEFSEWFLQQCTQEPQCPKFVLFSDEAVFTREGHLRRALALWDHQVVTIAKTPSQKLGVLFRWEHSLKFLDSIQNRAVRLIDARNLTKDLHNLERGDGRCSSKLSQIITLNDVRTLCELTLIRAEKSEILNHEELQIADQKVEFLRGAVAAITKKITPNGPTVDIDKVIKKTLEYQLGTTFIEESRQCKECPLFQGVLKSCGEIEQQLAKEFGDHETKVEEMVYNPLQNVLENDFPNILKHKQSLKKYCLDKDSASNRYQATGKETLREDMEEADTKVEQSRDALAVEMFSVLAKENELSEYILQLLKLQRSYHESALKNLEMLIPFLEHKIGNSAVRKVFGTSLKEHLRITGKRLAYPLEICITALSEYGLSEEGLFRVAASTTKVKRLKSSIDSGCFVALIPEYRDAHVLASLLKLYLR
nr:unnamed protein product [Callosobruchus analis]